MKKNVQRILATILTVIMMISMLPSNVFAADFDADMFVEPAVEAVSVPAEEQEVESTVEEVPVEADEIAEDISVEDAEAVQGSSEEFETVDAADPAAADEIEETSEAPVVDDKITLKAEGKDYVVTVTYDASALLPDDVKVTAKEIKANAKKYDDYCDQALEAVQQENADIEELSYTRLFDIKLVDADGNPLEPASAVDVQIRLKDVETVEENTQIVHFAGEEEIPEVIEPTVENDTVTFSTEGFSIYAVIGTDASNLMTVNFININPETGAETTLETVYVKKADTTNAEEFAKIVYDPGAGTVPGGYAFYGWSIDDADYSVEASGKTIDEVRDEIKSFDFSEDKTMNVYAMLAAFYTVKYIDEKGINLGTHTARVRKIGEEVSYTVNMGYSTDDTHNFEGWHIADGLGNITDPAGVTTETLLTNETEIKIKGDVKFSVSAPEGHWLVFDENGKHATYNAPRFVKTDEVTSDANMLDMVRNGYSFDGWWTGKPSEQGGVPGGQRFEFGHELTDTTTVYAKWDKAETANYTVIIWLEDLEDNNPRTYDYEDILTIEGNVDSTINTVVPTGSGNDRYARINGTDYKYNGFRYDHHDTGVTITPEGDAVVNVYYIRNTYTLTFRLGVGSLGLLTYDTITARYGTDISSEFPIKGSLIVRTLELLDPLHIFGAATSWLNSFYRWKPQPNSAGLTDVTVLIDTMPPADITFNRDTEITTSKTMTYYGEALPGQQSNHQWDGKNWVVISGPVSARYNKFTRTEDFMDLTGYVQYKSDPAFINDEVTNADHIDFYYTRQLEAINYMDGAYYDGNNVRMENGTGQLGTAGNIPFDSDITSYNKDGENYFTPADKEGYAFEGWFVDKPCTQPYTFKKMPAGGITVYAKWRQIQYRVFLRPNAGRDSSLDWGSENQETNFRVSYGGKVSVPEGKRTGYKFLGWYTDKECNKAVYKQSIILNDTTVWDEYDKTLKENMTDDSDKWGNADATRNEDVDRFWITQRFELFASWSKVIIGNGIGIIYDVGEDGTVPPTDTLLYQDNTTAVAGAAPKANTGKAFEKWVVQKWNGSASAFEDTDIEVHPGQTFRVYVDDAKIVDNDTSQVIPLSETVADGNYTYTIQLKAKYSDVEEKTPTHITWYKNDGSGDAYKTDDNLKINQRISVYGLGDDEDVPEWLGHKFLGWAKDIETPVDNEGKPMKDPETGEIIVNTSTTKNTADFLEYKDDAYYLPGTTTVVEEVAADEILPYEGLYAVWEILPQIQIYHSSTGDIETIQVKDIPADGLDLTGKVLTGNLYGGYYHYIDGEKGTAYEANGKALKVTEADYGTTYYLKEVPNTYLIPTIYLTYSTLDYDPPKPLRGLWIIMNVDPTYKDSEYKQIGFVRDGTNAPQTGVYDDLQVTKNGKTTTYTMSNFYGPDTTEGVLAIQDMSDYATLPANKDKSFTLSAYWVTPDNVKVTGVKERTYKMGNQTFTGWSGGDGLSYTTKSQASAAVPAGSVVATSIVNRQTYMAKSAPDILTYTVTKVDNGKTVTQVVEAGDNTGKIAYAGKTNYVFAGWYLDKSCTKAADFSAVSSDMTVYAKYVKTSAVKLSFTKKSSKSGSVTFKADLKISGAPALTDTSVNCDCKGKTSAVKFTGAKTTKSGKTEVNTYTGTVTVSGLKDKGSFTAAISYKTPDGTTVNLAEKTCKYASGLVTVK